MVNTIVINGSNVDPNDNSKYTYRFSKTVQFDDKQQIAITGLNIYYSWFNISSALNNNTFTIDFPFGNPTTINFTVPDGSYTISQLNSYIQSIMVSNNLYLIDGSGNYVYYIEFLENPSLYAVQLNSYPIPTALPAGYTDPGVPGGFPAVASTPQLTVSANAFSNIIGFNPGTYPSVVQATTYSKTSDFTPQVSPVQSVLVSCNLVRSPYSIPDNIIFGFAPNVGFGSIITPPINSLIWNGIQAGFYSEITLQFLDQNYNRLPINDTNLTVLMAIKPKSELDI